MSNIPPDPEGMNDRRAQWAKDAITHFQDATGADLGDALADLLCDVMHLCDREARKDDWQAIQHFEDALERARRCYREETTELPDDG